MALNVYKFQLDRDILNTISSCRENQECTEYCNSYSFTKLPTIFIGNINHLEEMHDFLRKNKADNNGFFEKELLTEEQQLEI